MKLFVAAVTLLALAACGDDGEPEVDWSDVPQNQRVVIEDAVAAGDCDRMQAAFDGSNDADVLDYLDWHMQDADCY